ncbi:MAG: hypothetical protein AAGJ35_01580, partial [Myxococcota bacterium]
MWMFWPLPERKQAEDTSLGRIPWFTLFWMLVLGLGFVWTRWTLSQADRRLKQTREDVYCYFLMNDFVTIPPQHVDFFPKKLRRHGERTRKLVGEYYRDALAQRQGREWLLEGMGGRSELHQSYKERGKGVSCIAHATMQRQFARSSRQRLFVTLAQLSTQKYREAQHTLKRKIRLAQLAKDEHPLWGNALRSGGSSLAWLTSPWIVPHGMSLLWVFLLLWCMGKMLENVWKFPFWGAALWLLTLGSHVLLGLGLQALETGMWLLGPQIGLSWFVGLWCVLYVPKNTSRWVLALPKRGAQVLHVPTWCVPVVWLVGCVLDVSILQGTGALVLLVYVLMAGLSGGLFWFLQRVEWLEVLLYEPYQATREELEKRVWETTAQAKQRDEIERQQRLERAQVLFQEKKYADARDAFLLLFEKKVPTLELLDQYLQSCEFLKQPASASRYIQAIRQALVEEQQDFVMVLYARLYTTHDRAAVSSRDHVMLAVELHKHGLCDLAFEESEFVLERGQQTSFFLKALLVQAEITLLRGEDPEAALRQFIQAQNFLEAFPEYEQSVEQGIRKAKAACDLYDEEDDHAVLRTSAKAVLNVPEKDGKDEGVGDGMPKHLLPGAGLDLLEPPPGLLNDSMGMTFSDGDLKVQDRISLQHPEGGDGMSWEEIPTLAMQKKKSKEQAEMGQDKLDLLWIECETASAPKGAASPSNIEAPPPLVFDDGELQFAPEPISFAPKEPDLKYGDVRAEPFEKVEPSSGAPAKQDVEPADPVALLLADVGGTALKDSKNKGVGGVSIEDDAWLLGDELSPFRVATPAPQSDSNVEGELPKAPPEMDLSFVVKGVFDEDDGSKPSTKNEQVDGDIWHEGAQFDMIELPQGQEGEGFLWYSEDDLDVMLGDLDAPTKPRTLSMDPQNLEELKALAGLVKDDAFSSSSTEQPVVESETVIVGKPDELDFSDEKPIYEEFRVFGGEEFEHSVSGQMMPAGSVVEEEEGRGAEVILGVMEEDIPSTASSLFGVTDRDGKIQEQGVLAQASESSVLGAMNESAMDELFWDSSVVEPAVQNETLYRSLDQIEAVEWEESTPAVLGEADRTTFQAPDMMFFGNPEELTSSPTLQNSSFEERSSQRPPTVVGVEVEELSQRPPTMVSVEDVSASTHGVLRSYSTPPSSQEEMFQEEQAQLGNETVAMDRQEAFVTAQENTEFVDAFRGRMSSDTIVSMGRE